MRESPRAPGGRLAALVVTAGALVAAIVAAASGAAGAVCSADGDCHALARTLAIRTGLVVGAVTVVMVLLAVGLLRMTALDEGRRADAGGLWE